MAAMKMIVDVCVGEWYPVYTIHTLDEFSDNPVEITKEFFTRYRKVMLEFTSVQKELEQIAYGDSNDL